MHNNLRSIPEEIFYSPSVWDVFSSRFDETWFANSDLPRVLYKLPIENAEDDGTVEYRYNEDSFRCDSFKTDHTGKHILFSGCSQTEGVASPIETVWSSLVYNEIKEDLKADGFFSLSKAGWGWQKIISNFLIYVDKYGKPDYLFVLLPDAGRMYDWHEKNNSWAYIQKQYHNSDLPENKRDVFNQLIKPNEYPIAFLNFVMGWRLFEAYCKSNSINLLWSSWDLEDPGNYKKMLSDSYIELSKTELIEFIREERPTGSLQQFDMFRRDNNHAGTLVNKYWAKKFLEAASEKGWTQ